jgi:hypothetical protein
LSEEELAKLLDTFAPKFKAKEARGRHTLRGVLAEIFFRSEGLGPHDNKKKKNIVARLKKAFERPRRNAKPGGHLSSP